MDSDKVSHFMAVTSSDAETANAYLDSCSGDVSAAIQRYFADADAEGDANAPAPTGLVSAPRAQAPHSRVAGLRNLSEEETEDGPEDNEYYAGGHNSGVAIRGGKKADHVESLFESARQHGAIQGTESDLRQPTERRVFSGQGRTLAGGVTSDPPSQRPLQPVVVAFYTNNVFTINDGEPRDMNDPANASFIDHIRQGRCPPELIKIAGGHPETVNIVKKGEEYKPPAGPAYTAFSGTGQTLSDGQPSLQPVYDSTQSGGEWEGPDESRPTTSIQIRLRDGSRVVARFNYNHTVRDIRRFIAASRPDLPNGGPMMTGHPSKVLEDDALTVEEADLVNAVVIQK